MSGIDRNSPQVSAIKSQYLEAQKNNDTTEMNKLKQKGMKLMKEIKKNEQSETKTKTESGVTNKDGDLIKISNEGLVAQKNDPNIEKSND